MGKRCTYGVKRGLNSLDYHHNSPPCSPRPFFLVPLILSFDSFRWSVNETSTRSRPFVIFWDTHPSHSFSYFLFSCPSKNQYFITALGRRLTIHHCLLLLSSRSLTSFIIIFITMAAQPTDAPPAGATVTISQQAANGNWSSSFFDCFSPVDTCMLK